MYPRELMDQARAASGVAESRERYKTCEVARHSFRSKEVVKPPNVPGVEDAVDMHCHTHGRQQDALALAKHASVNRMGGIVFKTIAGEGTPARVVGKVRDELHRFCETEKIAPTKIYAGFCVGRAGPKRVGPLSRAVVQEHLDDGCSVIWMPAYAHANTMASVATFRPDPADKENVKLQSTLPWDEAVKHGHFLLDEHGKLKSEARDIIHLIHDRNAVMSLGHTTRPEQHAIVEEAQKIGYRKAFMDHPFSPFIRATVEEMKTFADAGVYMNFTYNEISPMTGVDPLVMFDAAREVGASRCLLSSDAGDPFFPDSVECMRQMRVYAEAFGFTYEEAYEASATNPKKLLADVRHVA